jgi:purine-binding chemotaxis protein CheW
MIRDGSGNVLRVNDAFLSLFSSDTGTFSFNNPEQYLTKLPSGLVQLNLPSGTITCRELIPENQEDNGESLSLFINLSEEIGVINELRSRISGLEAELKQRKNVLVNGMPEHGSGRQMIGEEIDIVEFELNEEQYAIDISMVREVVEMLPITPLPKTPPYVIGIINLRGEVTHIIDLAILLGQRAKKDRSNQKIIIIPSDVTKGEHVGIIVDNVQSVTEIQGRQVSLLGNDVTDQIQTHIKGIIKITHDDILEKHADGTSQVTLVIWLDIQKILHEIQVQ